MKVIKHRNNTITKIMKTKPKCDVCDRRVLETSSRPILIGCDDMLCRECWLAWYDSGIVNKKKLKNYVLKLIAKKDNLYADH